MPDFSSKAQPEQPEKTAVAGLAAGLFSFLEKEILFKKKSALQKPAFKLKGFLTSDRDKRPSGYMNQAPLRDAYLRNYLPWHLPETFWIFNQVEKVYPTFFSDFFDLCLEDKNSFQIFDLGAGPATASLSFRLWLAQKEKYEAVLKQSHWNLWDHSSRVLDVGEKLLGHTLEKAVISKIHLPLKGDFPTLVRKLKIGGEVPKARVVFLSHTLNEMGNGPRFRETKLHLVESIFKHLAHPDGCIVVAIEPPLREPTLDLMWLRDQFPSHILAPCPKGQDKCPMALRKAGWCYAQPPRSWAWGAGLAQSSHDLDRDTMGFSYWVASSQPLADSDDMKNSRVAVSDSSQMRSLWCEAGKLTAKFKETFHRGQIKTKDSK